MTINPDDLNRTVTRTVATAQAELERIADAGELRPDVLKALREQVKSAADVSAQMVTDLASTHHDEVMANRGEWLQDVCGIRDDFATLEADIRAGNVSGAEARKRWNSLHNEHGGYRASVLAETERRAALVAEMEDDPVAYADGIYERMPNLTPKFSF